MGSPFSNRRCAITLPRLLPLLALAWLGMAKPPAVTVRVFAEANEHDTNRFAAPVALKNPPRQAFIEKMPSLNERYIAAIYPFQADDGTWGCAFKLDAKGRIDLEVVSTERRGSSLVVFVGTKKGTHQVVDMVIDRRVTDGIISVPRGLTEMEIAALTREFKVMGQKGKR